MSVMMTVLKTVIIALLAMFMGVPAVEMYHEWRATGKKYNLYLAVWLAIWFVLLTSSAVKSYLE